MQRAPRRSPTPARGRSCATRERRATALLIAAVSDAHAPQGVHRGQRADRQHLAGRPRGAQLPLGRAGERAAARRPAAAARPPGRARAPSPRRPPRARAGCAGSRPASDVADLRGGGERLVVELVEPRQRMVGGDRRAQRLAAQHGLDEPRILVLGAASDTQTPTSSRPSSTARRVSCGGGLLEQQLRRRQPPAQEPQSSGQHRAGGHRAGSEPQALDLFGLERLQLGLRVAHGLDDPDRVLVEQPAGLSEPNAARLADEQRRAGLGLELGHLLGHRRGRERERVGGTGERSAPHDFDERLETGQIHRQPSAGTSTAVVRGL